MRVIKLLTLFALVAIMLLDLRLRPDSIPEYRREEMPTVTVEPSEESKKGKGRK